MIKRQYSGNERRARNYIWNAAGRYDFEPSFLAFSPDGSPDMYYNLVIGLAYKWLDMEAIQEFIKRYSASRSAEEFDDLFWLGLENCVYEKEIGERPVLEKLRREKAEAWFKSAADMSRQQMEMQSMTVYEQQMIRWSEVLGRFCHTGKRSLALAGRLLFSGSPGLFPYRHIPAEGRGRKERHLIRSFPARASLEGPQTEAFFKDRRRERRSGYQCPSGPYHEPKGLSAIADCMSPTG